MITAARAEHRQVTRIWYPDERPALFELDNGSNASVVIGDPAYQVSDGEIVAL